MIGTDTELRVLVLSCYRSFACFRTSENYMEKGIRGSVYYCTVLSTGPISEVYDMAKQLF